LSRGFSRAGESDEACDEVLGMISGAEAKRSSASGSIKTH
jgi:hypothetical protein